LFLILCSIAIVGLILLPSVFGLAKAEKDIASVNVTSVYEKGLALYKLGNYSQAVRYFDKALTIDPKDENALTYKGIALDYLGNYA
jgi:Flp pilus assembly protein TadD